jgi:hypothetical protein
MLIVMNLISRVIALAMVASAFIGVQNVVETTIRDCVIKWKVVAMFMWNSSFKATDNSKHKEV